MSPRLAPIIEDRGHDTPCHIWPGSLNHAGYGRCWGGQAHRVAYTREVGPIPPGMELDHLCRVRACVNPAHLEAVTHQENMRRSAASRPVGHPFAALRRDLQLSQSDAARILGVSQSLVALWERGKGTMHADAMERLRTDAPPVQFQPAIGSVRAA